MPKKPASHLGKLCRMQMSEKAKKQKRVTSGKKKGQFAKGFKRKSRR